MASHGRGQNGAPGASPSPLGVLLCRPPPLRSAGAATSLPSPLRPRRFALCLFYRHRTTPFPLGFVRGRTPLPTVACCAPVLVASVRFSVLVSFYSCLRHFYRSLLARLPEKPYLCIRKIKGHALKHYLIMTTVTNTQANLILTFLQSATPDSSNVDRTGNSIFIMFTDADDERWFKKSAAHALIKSFAYTCADSYPHFVHYYFSVEGE